MAAKIRAMELLPTTALDMEYLKLYGVVFLGWLLTGIGTTLFFNGVPFLGGPGGGSLLAGFLGLVFGALAWLLGLIPLLAGLVALGQKAILESTREELVDIDRLTGSAAGSSGSPGSSGSSSSGTAGGSTIHAGARPSESTDAQRDTRVESSTPSGGAAGESAGSDSGGAGTDASTGDDGGSGGDDAGSPGEAGEETERSTE